MRDHNGSKDRQERAKPFASSYVHFICVDRRRRREVNSVFSSLPTATQPEMRPLSNWTLSVHLSFIKESATPLFKQSNYAPFRNGVGLFSGRKRLPTPNILTRTHLNRKRCES